MTAGTIAILAGITSAFLLFAVVLMWADRYSHQNRSQAAQPKPRRNASLIAWRRSVARKGSSTTVCPAFPGRRRQVRRH